MVIWTLLKVKFQINRNHMVLWYFTVHTLWSCSSHRKQKQRAESSCPRRISSLKGRVDIANSFYVFLNKQLVHWPMWTEMIFKMSDNNLTQYYCKQLKFKSFTLFYVHLWNTYQKVWSLCCISLYCTYKFASVWL